jgi:glutamate racemase
MSNAAFSNPRPRIGVFDSGIGGLSVLRAVAHRLPGASLAYIADSRHTPWGDRPAAWVSARCVQLAGWLIADGADLVLVACNTGTTQAIAALRARWPGQLFVGVEPGIKPAVAASRNHRVAVMATRGTLRSPRLQQLVDVHAGATQVLQLPCPGLAEAIEAAGDDPAPLDARLDALADALIASQADTVVLGCTHYPLVAEALRQRLGAGITLVDTADAVARRVDSLLGACPATDGPTCPATSPALYSTANPAALERAARRWLGGSPVACALTLPDAPDDRVNPPLP